MIKELIKLANHLDAKGLRQEAGRLDLITEKMAGKGPGRAWDPGKKWREHNLGAEEHTGEARNVEIDENILREIREAEGMPSDQAALLDRTVHTHDPAEVIELPPEGEDTTPDSDMERIMFGEDEEAKSLSVEDRLSALEEKLSKIEGLLFDE